MPLVAPDAVLGAETVRALELVDSWDAGAVATGVVARGRVLATRGDRGRRYELASVTKLLSAVAVEVAVEEGTVAYAEPAGPPGSTLAHLLSHASGLGPEDADRPIAPPGTRRIYSNAGIEVAARHTSERAGMDFAEYVRSGVLAPLGMDATVFEGSPAHGASSCLADLLLFAAELLEPRLVDASTARLARTVAFPGLAGVLPGFGRHDPCDWGLGPEVRGSKQPHWTATRGSRATFGHFGQSGAFVWVDPEAEIACVVLSERPFGSWAVAAWPVFADAVLAEVGAGGGSARGSSGGAGPG